MTKKILMKKAKEYLAESYSQEDTPLTNNINDIIPYSA